MVIVNIAGVTLIVLIVWWFWIYKPKEQVAVTNKRTLVAVQHGVYQPARIKVAANTEITIDFIRKDQSPCAAHLLFPDFEITQDLPLDTLVSVQLPKMAAGEYSFHCQMQMYKGTLLVE